MRVSADDAREKYLVGTVQCTVLMYYWTVGWIECLSSRSREDTPLL